MNYLGPLGRVFGGLKGLYSGINGATLTGAIDIIVVEQEDGTFKCSPFHVRFGKLGVLRSREKVVEIEINGRPAPIRMKLGESGEAFFVQELAEDEDEYDENLATSPLPGSSPEEFDSTTTSDVIRKGLEEFRKAEEEAKVAEEEKSSASASTDDLKKKKKRRKRRNQNGSKSDIVVVSTETQAPQPQQPSAPTSSQMTSDQIFSMDEDYVKDALKELQLTSSTPAPTTLTHSRSFHRDFHSDTEADVLSPSRPSTPIQSDTEYEISKTSNAGLVEEGEEVSKWAWGELPVSSTSTTVTTPPPATSTQSGGLTHTQKAPSDEEHGRAGSENRSMLAGMFSFMKRNQTENDVPGIYLDDVNLETMDREQAALYFPNYHDHKSPSFSPRRPHSDDDIESGKGISLPQSPAPGSSPKAQSHLEFIMESTARDGGGRRQQHSSGSSNSSLFSSCNFEAISLCGSNLSLFEQSQLTYDELAENPDLILQAPPDSIVVKVNGKFLPWPAVLPQLLSNTFFGRPLPSHVQNKLTEQYAKKATPTLQLQPDSLDSSSASGGGPSPSAGSQAQSNDSTSKSFWFPWRRSSRSQENPVSSDGEATSQDGSTRASGMKGSGTSSDDETSGGAEFRMVPVPSQESRLHTVISIGSTPIEKYKKSLRLNSEQIKSLSLAPGQNEVVFSVTTPYQGTTVARCHIYLWRWDDRVVISDIDGTITKSDVLGHVLPMIGRDWAQSGVAQLFTQIQANGYKLLYLSARAIGQATTTREYLRSIRQGDVSLPDGPLLLNPTSLMSALHREVIEKKPEEFKIACLRDVQLLFPSIVNPFYAGYGNRINDVWAYRAVDVPISRIFTINHKGELRHALTNTFSSSYTNLVELAEHIFPPYRLRPLDICTPTDGYSHFEFWRDPIATTLVPPPVQEGQQTATTTTQNTQQQQQQKDTATIITVATGSSPAPTTSGAGGTDVVTLNNN